MRENLLDLHTAMRRNLTGVFGTAIAGSTLRTRERPRAASGLYFLVLGDTRSEVLAQARKIASLLKQGEACAGSTDSAQPNRPKSNAHWSMPRTP